MSISSTTETHPFSKDNPFPAVITENRLLNRNGSLKETRHFVVDLRGSGLSYKAGDSLGVFPSNHPGDVEMILQALGAAGDEPVSPAALKLTEPLSLREALMTRLALNGPTQKFLQTLMARTSAPGETARLAGLLAPGHEAELSAYLSQREYIDLLSDFPGAKLTPQEFVDHLRRLVPRLYSIASSPRVHPQEVHLTVAVVRYEMNRRRRFGVCTTFMADRVQLGQATVPVFVSHSHFGPPEDPATDVIMVGPGTGVAPFRAFLQDRRAVGAKGRNWLFFGDHHRSRDFLYEEEWLELQSAGVLTRLDTAWSRDEAGRAYVQDRMREQAQELWRWLEHGAHFYVCGDARGMAKDVDAALHAIVAAQGGLTGEQAADYVKRLKREGRYQRDVY